MIVAVNVTSFICGANHELLVDFLLRLAQKKIQHTFVFITNDSSTKLDHLTTGSKWVVSAPWLNQPFFWKLWYNSRLPGLVKKLGADVVIHAGGVCSMRGNFKQLVFTNEYFFPEKFIRLNERSSNFFQKNIAGIISNADHIIVGSVALKSMLAATYKNTAVKVEALYPAVDELYSPADYFNKEATKEKFTEGKEYFLFSGIISGNESQVLNLFQAFSFFKKRQKSNMQLVLLAAQEDANHLVHKLRTYKYREEVKLITSATEIEARNIMAAAYAFVHPLPGTAYPDFVLRAIQCGLPLILADSPANKEIADSAALYVDPSNFMDIANNLMLVYKDEGIKTQLEEHAATISNQLLDPSPEATLWRIIASDE